MKKIKYFLLAVVVTLCVAAFFATSTVYAEEVPETPVTDESTEETPVLSEEDFNKIVEVMQGIIEKNTNIKQEDLDGISAKLEEFGITVSTKILVVVIGAGVVVFLVLMFCIKQGSMIKSLKKVNNTQAIAYNNQQALIEATDRENLSKAVSYDVCNAVHNQNADLRQELAKLHAENEVLMEQNKTMLDAMRTAWGNKVHGINSVLNKAPTQAAVDSLELQLKYYQDYIKAQNAEQAESIIVEIEKKAGV
jgi:hypothetical protein